MSRWPADILRSSFLRIALINVVLVIATLAGAFLAAWLATEASMEAAARDRIAIETNALLAELDDEGLPGVASAVNWRSRRRGALHYLIEEPGQAPVGDLPSAPREPGWHKIRMRHEAHDTQTNEHAVLVNVVEKQGGNGQGTTRVAVGEDLTASKAMRDMMFEAMMPVVGLALTIGLVLTVVGTRRTAQRMKRIIEVVVAVENGDLRARVPQLASPRDDIDFLGGAINGMLDQIDLLVATVERVSAEIAHDLRTPLTQVRHAVQAAQVAESQERRLTALEAAEEGIGQALRLFEEMLKLAEIDSGKMRADFAKVDLKDVVTRVVDAYRPEIEASGRTLTVDQTHSCPLRGNSDLLTQAVANLLSNALKHSKAGAAIRVKVALAETWIALAVEDDGPGVTPGDVATMLRPFGRLDQARRTPGNGLGLAITNSIAILHKGRVRVVNRDPGLAVILELPCGQEWLPSPG